ncbi:MAG: hypothetical protein ACW97X_04655, partial [Candidatus Hodarchaeales archaeon]
SFIFSIISILLTNNISQGSNFSLRLFARTMSNFTFYLGSISIAIGLIFTFFKAPEINKSQRLVKPKFKPKYHNKKLETSNTFPIIKKTSSPPLFSLRETKFILTGLINIVIAILIWVVYLVLFE